MKKTLKTKNSTALKTALCISSFITLNSAKADVCRVQISLQANDYQVESIYHQMRLGRVITNENTGIKEVAENESADFGIKFITGSSLKTSPNHNSEFSSEALSVSRLDNTTVEIYKNGAIVGSLELPTREVQEANSTPTTADDLDGKSILELLSKVGCNSNP